MAASRVNQERIQADLVESQTVNRELHRSDEELRRDLQTRAGEREGADQEPVTPPREFPTSFSQEIVDATIPATLVGPKVTFTGTEDPEAHLTAFHTQMMLVGGSDAVRCKLFMSTLAGTAMNWFISLLDGLVTSFPQLTKLFRAQYIANRAPPSISYDLFDVRQYQGESLKEFLHRFGAQVVRLNLKDEKMMMHALRKGIVLGPFSESLIRNHPKNFAEIRRRAVAHIAAEEEVSEKRTCVVATRPRATGCPQTLRVHEATKKKKTLVKQQPYQPRNPNGRGRRRENVPPRHDFVVELKDLIAIPNVVEKLKVPPKTDKRLGSNKNAWCEFHQAFGHPICNCLALGHQLDELVKNGLQRDYLQEKKGTEDMAATGGGLGHEVLVQGEVHTIARGFSGGGCTASQRRRDARTVMSVEAQRIDDAFDVDLVFTKADLEDVVPHDNDPVVISAVTAGRKVHRVLVDQGSSADVMFWTTFNKLQLSPDMMRPYGGCLYGFAGDQVEVREYLELRTMAPRLEQRASGTLSSMPPLLITCWVDQP
ncbi:uncharacterized protein [Phaseolus vulgaris]|uniref:uncharacterized protein n=1 Tax=Phaseolus vulgaris TaxID=3885 RepID=UPI0035CB6E32